ncbi:hypothetical protein K456DRAFT_43308 [Colletotrichum gloeosporioides 23]|nr:hypothetical protein K456DRAFT_43308 [Colletotrichum gloeosporioides 23]
MPEDEEGRSLADLYVAFFQDRLEHSSKHPVTGERMLELPQLGQLDRGYIQHTINKDDCEEALTYAFSHLIDTVQVGTTTENDEDISPTKIMGGSGLFKPRSEASASARRDSESSRRAVTRAPHQRQPKSRCGPTHDTPQAPKRSSAGKPLPTYWERPTVRRLRRLHTDAWPYYHQHAHRASHHEARASTARIRIRNSAPMAP